MSALVDLLEGIAGMIAAGVPGATYETDPATAFSPDQTAIVMMVMPETPDRVIAVNAVPMTDSPTLPHGVVMVQVACRGRAGSALDVNTLADAVCDVLHGTTNLTFGSVSVEQMNRTSSIPMGQDDHTPARFERVDKFYLDVAYPPTVNRPSNGSW